MCLSLLCAGAVVSYSLVHLSVWAVLQAVFMFWSVAYPFSFRQLKITGKIRYAHIISILLALLIPLPSAFTQLAGGSVFTTNLVVPCLGRNRNYIYYTFILPISLLLGGGLVLLMLVIWILFKVGGHRGLIQIRFCPDFQVYVNFAGIPPM